MSTIERIAELLGPIGSPKPASSVPNRQDSIKLAVTHNTEHSRIVEAWEFAIQQESIAIEQSIAALAPEANPNDLAERSNSVSGLARFQSGTSAIFKVDRIGLRRQGIITPDDARTPNTESF